ncbi:MAG: UDP-N-acetylmuramate--L-alanine ligase [Patescibacteria group bacterium]|jgi:UDP-N-acetylmuramate--alanine ligase
MNIKEAKKVYFLGIGGIGISGLAKICQWQGKQVSGSDLAESELTDNLKEANIPVFIGQKAENVPKDADLYVYSAAVPENNPEREQIKKLGKQDKEINYFQAVGQLMKDYEYCIAISGTHGKTTTTAMLASILIEDGSDPTVIVGSMIKQLNSNSRLGKNKKYFVVEACEHKEHMMNLSPNAIVLTNIEEDHLDYYRDLEHIQITFQNYINKLPKHGILVKNNDDSESKELGCDSKVITYGIKNRAHVMAKKIRKEKLLQKFSVGKTPFTLQIPGDFNIYNALSVIALARELGIPDNTIKKALKEFAGTWRRFEQVGSFKGATVISDYAHHPTAVAATIKAAREFYPGRRIVVLFQPHQHNRTKRLFEGFTKCFKDADLIMIHEIFDVAGREESKDQDVTSADLVKAVEKTGKYVFHSDSFEKAQQLLHEHVEKNDVLLILGAGDIYKVALSICSPSR